MAIGLAFHRAAGWPEPDISRAGDTLGTASRRRTVSVKRWACFFFGARGDDGLRKGAAHGEEQEPVEFEAEIVVAEAWWRGCVQEWERSGESQAGFARRKGVAYATFNWWKLRILKPRRGPARVRGGGHKEERAGRAGRGRAGRTRPVLLPVEVKPAVAAASWSVEIECRNGRVLRLRDLLDAGALSALLGALEAERRC